MRAASEFYALRDQRTDACLGAAAGYATRAVRLSIDDRAADTGAGQLAYLLSANLLARWCRHVIPVGSQVTIVPPLERLGAGEDLVGLATAIARSADPYISTSQAPSPIELHIGSVGPKSAFPVSGDGWMCTSGDAVANSSNDIGIGAVLAACVGVAWAFRVAIDDETLPQSSTLSLWNLRGGAAAIQGPTLRKTDLGDLLLVGCGAVGSALAYLLPLVQLEASVTAVDGDSVEISNLNRSPLFCAADEGARKVGATCRYLNRWGITAIPIDAWFDEAVSRHGAFARRPDLVVPAANEHGVRHAIQHQVPPLQVYGTTGRDWQAFLGRHIPLKDDCLACRFPAVAASAPALACSMGAVSQAPPGNKPQDAALPFLSTASAALALAEILKATTTTYPLNANFGCLDFKGALTDFFQDSRERRADCICGSQLEVWNRLNGKTRWAWHSR